MAKEKSAEQDVLKTGLNAFKAAKDAAQHNREASEDDIKFARLGEQWPADILEQRERDKKPALTINKMPAFIRQVVNDARQNKPSIKVHPADDNADPETAKVINGLIRNIEYTSNADVAYDTGVECAVSGGVGYWRVDLDYAFDDAFDLDITINRIANPMSVYGDPKSIEADSSDWDNAFITELMPKEEFEAKYPDADTKDFDDEEAWKDVDPEWFEDGVLVAEWWTREEVEKTIYRTVDGMVLSQEQLDNDKDIALGLDTGIIQLATDKMGQPLRRVVKSHKVIQRIITGGEILEETEWPGKYIPIIPVYGDEFIINGKRYLRSLIHDAKDAQRMFNYWRTVGVELVALAPKVPYIGKKGSFAHDQGRWETANTESHAYLEYEGDTPPQRQPLDSGVAAGALQEALNASDDMKAIIGMYDASLGARSNETSGRAIMARQREGDVSTFHFIDNMARAIRHTGRIIIDLIPSVYDTERVVRTLGEDGAEEAVPVNQQFEQTGEDGKPKMQRVKDEQGNEVEQAVIAMHDLTSGKYDLTVTTGPSFTTRRQEAAAEMTEIIRAFPDIAPLIADLLAKNLDWPGADEMAERLKRMVPPQALGDEGELPPQIQQFIEQGKQMIDQLTAENEDLKNSLAIDAKKADQQHQLGLKKAQNDYDLGLKKIQNERQLEIIRNDGIEQADENGEVTVRSKNDIGFEAVMQGLEGIGQLIVQQGETNNTALENIARVVAAPNELVRDQNGRPIGSRKAIN